MSDYEPRSKSATQSRATAGPSESDRFGSGLVGKDMEARILKHDVDADRTLITIAKGKSHGVHANMEGYVKQLFASFIIQDVYENRCTAFVDATPDEVKKHLFVVINPSSIPRAPSSNEPRVIACFVEGGRTKLTISRGTAHGIAAGARATLFSADGREGDDFIVDYATSRQCFGYIASPTDHVTAHPLVRFDAAASSSKPVQRRADGTAATADVQSTARAGVANASSPLPYFDIIQRSFGKHDISNIQAQVGGAATTASTALGARAYATGDKVAFASAPDLHTAAHEAAHTIQQRHGAVGFQGLGAADDEHERHADAVADAVVAGQSAEPLLDRVVVVGGTASPTVQRKTDENGVDTTRASSLVLRMLNNVAVRAQAVSEIAGLAVAVEEVRTLLAEVQHLVRLRSPHWDQLRAELAAATGSLIKLKSKLRPYAELASEERALGRAIDDLEVVVPAAIWNAPTLATPVSNQRLETSENLELAREAFAAAAEQAKSARAVGGTRRGLAVKCLPIANHFNVAAHAARAISDRTSRRSLSADMERTSVEMDRLQEHISMEPKMEWHPAFAAAFDAENRVRKVLGLTARDRTYSGSVDPRQALDDAARMASEPSAAAPGPGRAKATTPQQAISKIMLGFAAIQRQQTLALGNAIADLKQTERPKPTSGWDVLLDIAVSAAISAATGGIGALVANGFRKALEQRFLSSPAVSDVLSKAPQEMHAQLKSDLLKDGALARAVATDAAKDSVKEVFKSGAKKALEIAKNTSKPNTTDLLDAYRQGQEQVLAGMTTAVGERLIALSDALRQVHVPVLDDFGQRLIDELTRPAYDTHYEHTMREWQNLKARHHGGLREGKTSSRDARIGDEHVLGTFEVAVRLITHGGQRSLSLQSLRLRGAEPQARAHFIKNPRPLASLGMNQRYEVECIIGYRHSERIIFGVGADEGLQVEALSPRELLVLKIVAAGDAVNDRSLAFATMHGEYDHVTDAAATDVARSIVDSMGGVTTARLEK